MHETVWTTLEQYQMISFYLYMIHVLLSSLNNLGKSLKVFYLKINLLLFGIQRIGKLRIEKLSQILLLPTGKRHDIMVCMNF